MTSRYGGAALSVWTIRRSPPGAPGRYAVRGAVISPAEPTTAGPVWFSDTLAGARHYVPIGLIRYLPDGNAGVDIVEVWL